MSLASLVFCDPVRPVRDLASLRYARENLRRDELSCSICRGFPRLRLRMKLRFDLPSFGWLQDWKFASGQTACCRPTGGNQMMKKHPGMLLLAACMLGLVACSATPTKPNDNKPSVVYDKPEAQVQKAAVDALTENGFVISKSDAELVEGARPHKMGALVGSGGESAGVWLSADGADKTAVKVSTAKSLLGIAGQKNWDKEIIAAMDKSLGAHE